MTVRLELQRERELLTGARYENVENSPFTSDEQAEIAQQLREVKELVKNKYALSDAQMLSVGAKLDEIQAAAERLGRKDWKLVFLGAMFGVLLDRLVPQEAVRDILVVTFHGLDHLLGGGGALPQLPPTS